MHTDPQAPDPRAMGKVAVLYGGRSSEREVSMMSGAGVLDALRRRGVDAHAFDPAERALEELRREGFERAFIALHGRYGEDGTVQGALELLELPYTGSGVMASAIAMDKVFTKRIWLTHGLPTPAFAPAHSAEDVSDAAARFGLPLAVKPSREGSTIGFTKLTAPDQAQVAWEIARRHDDEVLCEEFVAGRELTVAILGTGSAARALPIIEIVAPAGNYDYQNKYFRDDTRYVCPAELPEALAAALERTLTKDPEQRFATPGELAAALAPFTEGHDLPALMRTCRERLAAAGEDVRGEVPTPESLGLMLGGKPTSMRRSRLPSGVSS